MENWTILKRDAHNLGHIRNKLAKEKKLIVQFADGEYGRFEVEKPECWMNNFPYIIDNKGGKQKNYQKERNAQNEIFVFKDAVSDQFENDSRRETFWWKLQIKPQTNQQFMKNSNFKKSQ